jgi:phospholipase D
MRFLSLVLATGLIASSASASVASDSVEAKVSVCFVPAESSCVEPIVNAIHRAKKTIRVQAYGFTSVPILKALLDAKKSGIDVQIILDKSNSGKAGRRYTGATTMMNADVPVDIDTRVAIAHNKVIIIDDQIVVGGSYNYTTSADKRNAENVTIIESSTVAGWFAENWKSRKAVSTPYVPAD